MSVPVRKQILSGMQIVGIGLVCLVFTYALFDGFRRLFPDGEPTRPDVSVAIGLMEIVAVSMILWLTIRTWSRWIAPLASFVALKSLIGVIAGTSLSPPFRPVPRLVPAETLVYLACAALLSMRFLYHRPTALEKVALVIFIVATCAEMELEPSLFCLLAGLGPLAWVRLMRKLSPHLHDITAVQL